MIHAPWLLRPPTTEISFHAPQEELSFYGVSFWGVRNDLAPLTASGTIAFTITPLLWPPKNFLLPSTNPARISLSWHLTIANYSSSQNVIPWPLEPHSKLHVTASDVRTLYQIEHQTSLARTLESCVLRLLNTHTVQSFIRPHLVDIKNWHDLPSGGSYGVTV